MKKIILFYSFLLLSFFQIYTGEMSAPEIEIKDKPASLFLLGLAAQYLMSENENTFEDFYELQYLLKILKKNKESIREKISKTEKKYKHSLLGTPITNTLIDYIYASKTDAIKELYRITKPITLTDKFASTDYKASIQKKLILLTEALYLQSDTQDDLNKNSTLYKKLSISYHPDKLDLNLHEDIRTSFLSFFKEYEPLLSKNVNNEHLPKLLVNITKKLKKKLKETIRHEPPLALAIPYAILARSLVTAAYVATKKTVLHFLPSKTKENILRHNFVHNLHKSTLKIESELIKSNYRLSPEQRISINF